MHLQTERVGMVQWFPLTGFPQRLENHENSHVKDGQKIVEFYNQS